MKVIIGRENIFASHRIRVSLRRGSYCFARSICIISVPVSVRHLFVIRKGNWHYIALRCAMCHAEADDKSLIKLAYFEFCIVAVVAPPLAALYRGLSQCTHVALLSWTSPVREKRHGLGTRQNTRAYERALAALNLKVGT